MGPVLAFCVLFLIGCSSSLVLLDHTPDPAFVRAEQLLTRTATIVDTAKPSNEERALFMQAESFFQYLSWKSKAKATAWSLIPGGGQFYVGAYGSGAIRLTIALGAAAAVVAPIAIGIERRNELTWDHDWPLLVTGTLGVIVLSLDYTNSYQDAIRRVVQFNERLQAAFEDAHPEAP